MAESSKDATERLRTAGETLADRVRDRPYPMLALAAMAGYVAGGGLFSRLTRPVARAALGVLLVPGVRDRLRGLSQEFRSAEGTA